MTGRPSVPMISFGFEDPTGRGPGVDDAGTVGVGLTGGTGSPSGSSSGGGVAGGGAEGVSSTKASNTKEILDVISTEAFISS